MTSTPRNPKNKIAHNIMIFIESSTLGKPPRPMVLAGTIIKELGLRPSEFYVAVGRLMLNKRVGEVVEGRKRYYYSTRAIEAFRRARTHPGQMTRRNPRNGTERRILEVIESFPLGEPPRPMVLAGTVLKELGMSPSRFYLAAGKLMEGRRIGEVVEGRKRYYYPCDLIEAFRMTRR